MESTWFVLYIRPRFYGLDITFHTTNMKIYCSHGHINAVGRTPIFPQFEREKRLKLNSLSLSLDIITLI